MSMKTVYIVPFMVGGIVCVAVCLLLAGLDVLLQKNAAEQEKGLSNKVVRGSVLSVAGLIFGTLGVGFLAFAVVVAYSTRSLIF